ncbi:MAG: hypothetical protein WCA55_22090, partial [Xanthobacteraceae bacterium]
AGTSNRRHRIREIAGRESLLKTKEKEHFPIQANWKALQSLGRNANEGILAQSAPELVAERTHSPAEMAQADPKRAWMPGHARASRRSL